KRKGPYLGNKTPTEHCCVKCGHGKNGQWKPRPSDLLQGDGCPVCAESKGEKTIARILDKTSVLYKRQARFLTCRNTRALPFDFHILRSKVLIEYHGEQHYHPVKPWGGKRAFKTLKHRDGIKRRWAKRNGYRLIVIPYWEKDIKG